LGGKVLAAAKLSSGLTTKQKGAVLLWGYITNYRAGKGLRALPDKYLIILEEKSQNTEAQQENR